MTTRPGRPPVPDGTRIVLDRRTRVLRLADGRVRLLGGDPVTLVTPSAAAARLLDARTFTVDDHLSASLARALTDRSLARPDVRGSGARSLAAVAAVVPVRDDDEGLSALLDALAPDRARGLRVVVVDDGSHTPVPPTVGVRVLRTERSRGPAAARNAGTVAAVADGAEVVVYLDADVLPTPGWIDPLLAHLDDPAVCAVAPRIVAAEPGRWWTRGVETARSALDLGHEPARVRPLTRVPYVPSAALAVRLAALPPGPDGAAGPFDERLRVAEDVDLCWRIDAGGAVVRYEPASRVAHRHRTDLSGMLRRRAFYGTGAAPLAARHGSAVAPAVATPWSLALAAGVWSGTAPGLLVAALASVWAWRHTAARVGDGRAAAALVGRGTVASVRQLPSAALRPYWPVTVAALALSAPSRGPVARACRCRIAAAAVVEGLWHWWECREPGRLPVDDPVGHVVLHRLDDLAYGTGVWRSAFAARSWAALRPELRR